MRPAETRATVIPALRYRDASAAVEWLCRAFGFARHAVYEDGGKVFHAELTFGNGMIMLGPVADTPFGANMVQPAEVGGRATQTLCVIVDDADAHFARAKAEGAEIVFGLETKPYGGRDYTCRDPEGHIWTFGTYDPWATNPA